MIPKKLHYCWFGPKDKPKEFYRYLSTWKEYLPDYEIIEWNENNFDINLCNYSREACLTGNYAHLSDVCRVYALYTVGGIYIDTDVEVLGSFDPFLSVRSFLGVEHDLLGTGLMGSEPGTAWLKAFLNYYNKTHFINIWGHTVRTPNTKILTKRVLPKVPAVEWPTIFPNDFFCGKNWYTGEIHVTPNTVSIHHFAASWRRKKTFKEKITSLIEGFDVRYLKK